MLFSFLRMLLWVMLMVAVVISSVVLNKLKIVQKHKILKFIPVILVLILFFVPFSRHVLSFTVIQLPQLWPVAFTSVST